MGEVPLLLEVDQVWCSYCCPATDRTDHSQSVQVAEGGEDVENSLHQPLAGLYFWIPGQRPHQCRDLESPVRVCMHIFLHMCVHA